MWCVPTPAPNLLWNNWPICMKFVWRHLLASFVTFILFLCCFRSVFLAFQSLRLMLVTRRLTAMRSVGEGGQKCSEEKYEPLLMTSNRFSHVHIVLCCALSWYTVGIENRRLIAVTKTLETLHEVELRQGSSQFTCSIGQGRCMLWIQNCIGYNWLTDQVTC